MAFDSITGERIVESVHDKRIAVALADSLRAKPSDDKFKAVWRALFAAGVVESLQPPDTYDIRCPF